MRSLILFFFSILTVISFSQDEILMDSTKFKIRLIVDEFFDSMRESDTSLLRSLFSPDATLQTTYIDKAGNEQLINESIDEFFEAVGAPHDKEYNEKITNLQIVYDSNLAHAWMDYKFFLGDQFSHCGVNSFTFLRKQGKWKILHIIDTRQRENCD